MQALYRKWRPRTFNEVIGQGHVVHTLRNALASGRIHHAYLFAGPRGTGKTTTARLLAKAVNCLAAEGERPCNQCAICEAINEGRLIDLIEIDAASNTGVDNVRELRERVGFRPTEARYKVYVIDEVHMLSTSAFNALLKTLEEPPPHVIFVLATTEAHKIPETVISRCQRFNFRRISTQEIVERLAWIVEQEGIPAEHDALMMIARQATGSMRDAESLLDQLASYNQAGITVAGVQAALGTGSGEAIFQVVDALSKKDAALGLEVINRAVDEGSAPRQFARQMVEHLRTLLLLRLGGDGTAAYLQAQADSQARLEAQAQAFSHRDLAKAIRLFNQAAVESRGGWQPQLPLEMAFIEAVLPPDAPQETPPSPSSRPQSPPSSPPSRPRPRPSSSSPSARAPSAASPLPPTKSPSSGPERPAPQKPSAAQERGPLPVGDGATITVETIQQHWGQALNAMRPRSLFLEALMRSCRPVAIEKDVIVLGFDYEFHRSKVDEEQNRREIEGVLSTLLGKRYRVRCVLGQSDRNAAHRAQTQAQSQSQSRSQSHSNGPPPTTATAQPEPSTEDPLVRMAVEELGATVINSNR